MQAQTVLHKLLMNTCPNIHKVRRQSLEANVLAALTGQCLTVTALGRAMHSEAKQKHCIKRADRLLSNGHLQSECLTIYRAIALRLIGGRQRPIILIDWSDMDDSKRHFLLRASVPVAGSSQTLYEEVHDNEAKEKPETHRRFLMRLQAMLPEGLPPYPGRRCGVSHPLVPICRIVWMGLDRPHPPSPPCRFTGNGRLVCGQGPLCPGDQHREVPGRISINQATARGLSVGAVPGETQRPSPEKSLRRAVPLGPESAAGGQGERTLVIGHLVSAPRRAGEESSVALSLTHADRRIVSGAEERPLRSGHERASFVSNKTVTGVGADRHTGVDGRLATGQDD